MRGNLSRIADIPLDATHSTGTSKPNVWGTGFTPEGIDQNPMFYDILVGQNWRAERIDDMSAVVVGMAHRRYGATYQEGCDPATEAWSSANFVIFGE